VSDFCEYSKRKVREAAEAQLTPLATVRDESAAFECVRIGNDWSRHFYDGWFHLVSHPASEAPLISLVFVRSRDGDTATDNPDSLGGGPIDKHLIYEGLTRVAADAVLAGAKSARGERTFFSVWHPELVSLRASLGLPRHPDQIVVSGSGAVDLEHTLLFNVPGVRVFILSTPGGCQRLECLAAERPGIELVAMAGGALRNSLSFLRRHRGIRRISAIGGRTVASALIDEGLVQDVCLTTTGRSGGEPNTPFYTGNISFTLRPLVQKQGTDPAFPIVFEHSALSSAIRN
jgi:riboflavin biosynthesis pyrimidine reductase